jgi:pyruvate formate lyase activating enzyme
MTRPDQRGADSLAIAGLTPLSTVDWPDHLAATVFLQGCPWRCGYCHNASIIDPREPGIVPWPDVIDLLGRRRGLLDGVVFSGGEPTRQPGLADAMRQVKDLGFGVALHTGGAFPAALARVLDLVDWVGLDVKAPPRLYETVTRVPHSAEVAFESLDLVLASGVAVQVRTTVDPTVLDDDGLAELSAMLRSRGVEHTLQEVRTQGTTVEFQERLSAVEDGTRSVAAGVR